MSTGAKQTCFRVGVIGLGRLWEVRHRPALERLSRLFRVTAVYDQVAARARREAMRMSCAASSGILSLVERPDVDVLLILTPQWFGLYPLQLASELGKPAYCAAPLAGETPEHLEELDRVITSKQLIFVPEFARRCYPATLRLRELLATRLGQPRLLICQTRLFGYDRYGSPGPSTQIAPASLLVDPGTYLLDWCRFILGGEPVRSIGMGGVVLPTSGTHEPDFEEVNVQFNQGAMAQVTITRFHRDIWGDPKHLPQPGIQVFAERGMAWIEPPDRIHWTDAEGSHEERLPIEPSMGETLLTQFHRKLRGEASLAPSWHDAMTVARLVAQLQHDRPGISGR